MKPPWRRARERDASVEAARLALEKALADRQIALALAEHARALRKQNGFAEAIRQAMGDRQ